MTLQRRLTLFFVVIVILPLAAASWLVQRLVHRELGRQLASQLVAAVEAAHIRHSEWTTAIEDVIRARLESSGLALALHERQEKKLGAVLANFVHDSSLVDFLIAVDTDGNAIAWRHRDPEFVEDFEAPDRSEIVDSPRKSGRGFTRTDKIPIAVPGKGRIGGIVGGFWIDAAMLGEDTGSAAGTGSAADLSIVIDGTVVASTSDSARGSNVTIPEFRSQFDLDMQGELRGLAVRLGNGPTVLATISTEEATALSRNLLLTVVFILVLALALTAILGYFLARPISQPLEELAQGAKAIAEGRFEQRIPVRSRDEVGQLAIAFNDMTTRLRDTITQLQSSHDQLRRAVTRVGDTLRSTHDMKQILETVLYTAADAVQADGAVMWLLTQDREELYPMMSAGVEEQLSRVPVGAGIVGLVAERANAVLVPAEGGGLRPGRTEPKFPTVLAVPVYRQDRLIGVIACYGRQAGERFDDDDREAVQLLAEQAAVALENVMLHEEARRLSLTDGLTGVWNRRYLQMQFRQVLATAHRFSRPFSLLMLDVDKFKEINDTYGHQRGDEILVELTTRVSRTLREVDTLARYGGDEFVCLLSETDQRGAITTAHKIGDAIRSEPFGREGDEPLALTVSVGVACYPEHGNTFVRLVEAADQALFRSKELGRNRVQVAQPQDVPPEGPPSLKVAK